MSAEVLWRHRNDWKWREDKILTSPSDEERAEFQVAIARLSLNAVTPRQMEAAARKLSVWRSKL